ncbi:hypothetical protein ACW9HR_25235 [Nocardia gipuzkoensis]
MSRSQFAAPTCLHTLIAHEPVTPWLLAAADRAAQLGELEHCQRVFAEQGWRAALAPMVRTLGIDPENQEREPGVTAPPLGPDRAANFEYFLGHDFTAIREDHLDVAALRRSPVRIVPACGRHHRATGLRLQVRPRAGGTARCAGGGISRRAQRESHAPGRICRAGV